MKQRGRYPLGRTGGRNQVEDYQAMLMTMLIDLDEIKLRVSQAIRRSSSVSDVLEPVIPRLESMTEQVETMQGGMCVIWQEREAVQWQPVPNSN